MLDLASTLSALPERQGDPPWPGHEYVKGWGVFGLPFDSGHVLALRVFPENDFSPYRTVWHRDPQGRWAIYVDGASADTACPRYYGPACQHVGYASIRLEWTGPASLRVTMDRPALEWTVTARQTPSLAVMNAVSPRLPLSSWRPRSLLRAREVMAKRAFGLGDIKMSGTMPSGHEGVLMPERMYLIDESSAVLDGIDLGHPTRVAPNPTIGSVPLPARGVLAVGGGVWKVLDSSA
jgi:hypothetical protein